jgi:hypothetical protein
VGNSPHGPRVGRFRPVRRSRDGGRCWSRRRLGARRGDLGRRRPVRGVGLRRRANLLTPAVQQRLALLQRARLRAPRDVREPHRVVLRHVRRLPERRLPGRSVRVLTAGRPLRLERGLLRRRAVRERDLLQPDWPPVLSGFRLLQRKLHGRTLRLRVGLHRHNRRRPFLRHERRLLQRPVRSLRRRGMGQLHPRRRRRRLHDQRRLRSIRLRGRSLRLQRGRSADRSRL